MTKSHLQQQLSDTMMSCVDMITNEALPLNASNDSGIVLTKRPRLAEYDIYVQFHGVRVTNGEAFYFEPLEIKSLVITQKFNENYMDDISLSLSLTGEQALTMIDNYRDLKVELILRYADRENDYVDTEEPALIKEYLVVFKDKELRKRINKQKIIPESGLEYGIEQNTMLFENIEVQLIDPKAYVLRKRRFNCILRDATVKDAILWIAHCCEITKISLPEPDNDKVYKNLIIPPLHTFETAMQFLSTYYGVYEKGLGFYYTDEILYIYQLWETKPDTPKSIHIYSIGDYSFAGGKCYHAYAEDITHIVINNQVNTKSLVDGGVETIGNDFTLQYADRIIDLYSDVYEAADVDKAAIGFGKLSVRDGNIGRYTFDDYNKDDYGIQKNVYNQRFFFDFSNTYKYREFLYAYKRSIYQTVWTNGVPFTILPGQRINFHFDGEDISRREQGEIVGKSYEFQTIPGTCESIVYTFKQLTKPGTTFVYGCNAEMFLSIEYEGSASQSEQGIDSAGISSTGGGSGSGRSSGGGGGGSGGMEGLWFDNSYDSMREMILHNMLTGKPYGCMKVTSKYFPECNGFPSEIMARYGKTGLPATARAREKYKEMQAAEDAVQAEADREAEEMERDFMRMMRNG